MRNSGNLDKYFGRTSMCRAHNCWKMALVVVTKLHPVLQLLAIEGIVYKGKCFMGNG